MAVPWGTPGGWRYIGRPAVALGDTYKDQALANGPIKRVTLKTGKLIKASGKGSGLGHGLAANPDPVAVVLRLGTKEYCLSYGGTVSFRVGERYLAKDAPPPLGCAP